MVSSRQLPQSHTSETDRQQKQDAHSRSFNGMRAFCRWENYIVEDY